MRSFLPLSVYCISLLWFQQVLASPVENHLQRNRLDLFKKLHVLREEEESFTMEVESDPPSPPDSRPPPGLHHSPDSGPPPGLHHSPDGLLGLPRDTLPSNDLREFVPVPALAWAGGSTHSKTQRRASRGRRHAHPGSRGGHHPHPAQLMRVGCVLGTCQVQNLSHRLYQLVGQSGREDSSPVNPRSPHSYG